jgi:hypothetical protein
MSISDSGVGRMLINQDSSHFAVRFKNPLHGAWESVCKLLSSKKNAKRNIQNLT